MTCGIVICQCCKIKIRDAPELKEGAVSHGICDECRMKTMNQFLQEFANGTGNVPKLGAYLNMDYNYYKMWTAMKEQVLNGKDRGDWTSIVALRIMNKLEEENQLAPLIDESLGTNEC